MVAAAGRDNGRSAVSYTHLDVYKRQATQTLEVEFQGDRIYHYYGVPWAVFADLQQADSKGRFFNSQILSLIHI